MSLKEAVKGIIGDSGYETLQKAIVKPRLRAAVDPLEFFLPLIIAPRAILSWLIQNIKPMRIGEYKDLHFPGREDILVHVEKQDIDMYKAEFVQAGRIVHSFDKQTLPAMSAHLMTVGEVYDGYVGEEVDPKDKPVVMDRKEAIDEHENLVNILENPTDKKLEAEADKQKKELKDYKEGGSSGVVHAIIGEIADESEIARDPEAAKWFYSHQNVKELTSVIGKLVDALVEKKVNMDKKDVEPKKEPVEEPTKKEEIVANDQVKEQPPELKVKNLPRLALARVLRRRKARHPKVEVPRVEEVLPNEKAEMPSGAGMAKQPVQPKPPVAPVPPSNKPAAAAAKQSMQAAKGLQAKPPTPGKSSPQAPVAPTAPKAPSLKSEEFIPPSKTYFRKKLSKLGKAERISVPITEAEILSPCPHCNKPEFTKSEGGYKFTPCYCFGIYGKLASIQKSEDGSLRLYFAKGIDKETQYAFLINLKAKLLENKEE